MSEAVGHVDIGLAGLSVMVGIPAGRDFPPQTVSSLLGTFDVLRRLGVPAHLGMVINSGVVQWARDEVVDIFLASEANRLFWVDSDMDWQPAQFMRLLALSQRLDIVGASYAAKRDQPTFFVRLDPERAERNEYGLLSALGFGLGFTVMTRAAVEAIAAASPRVLDQVSGKEIAEVFRVGGHEGRRRGEDMAFFADLRRLGYPAWLDPDMVLGHVGPKVYSGRLSDALAPPGGAGPDG